MVVLNTPTAYLPKGPLSIPTPCPRRTKRLPARRQLPFGGAVALPLAEPSPALEPVVLARDPLDDMLRVSGDQGVLSNAHGSVTESNVRGESALSH